MKYKILSLDGGGSWALLQVRALISIYQNDDQTPGHVVLEDFDLAAANSGGSIVLGALLENRTLGQIRDFFLDEQKRRSIFSPNHSITDAFYRLLGFGPKYSTKQKLLGLRSALPLYGDKTLSDIAGELNTAGINLHILITSFDYDRNRSVFFRSAAVETPGLGKGETTNATLADAIHASSNAPVNYFDAPAEFPNDSPGRFWDGGIAGLNNPVHAAAIEAIALGAQPTDIAALSIGTGSVVLPAASPGDSPSSPLVYHPIDPGPKTDLRKLATSIVDDPPDAASFIAHVMTGSGVGLESQPSRIVRMNPLVSPQSGPDGKWTAPGGMSVDEFSRLANLNLDAVEQDDVTAINNYADLWLRDIARNQPIRMDGKTLACELGHDKFSAALASWNALSRS